jgi:hypothetical protein
MNMTGDSQRCEGRFGWPKNIAAARNLDHCEV